LEIESLLSNLVQIQSVNPPGGETEVAKYLKSVFDEHHIPNEIIESKPGRGSFFAYLGEGERSLLYAAHLDVVPVSDGWRFAPFSGEIKDGFVYGRGTLDCKGLVAAEAYAMIQLAKSGKLNGRLIFVAGADEEDDSKFGVEYLVKNHKDKLMADFAINEGGRPPLKIGDKICHFPQIGEKGVCWMKLKAKGVSTHGSLPMFGDNAVIKMAEVIKKLSEYQPRTTLIPEVKQLIQGVAQLEGHDVDINEENVDQILTKLKDRFLSGYLTATTRMTVSPNVVQGGAKTNIIPDSCEAEVDIRMLPGQDEKYIVDQLSSVIGNLEREIIQFHAPTFSTTDSEYYRVFQDTMKESLGDVVILPCISTGATDSRYLREIGIPSYGINMMTLYWDDEMRQAVHGKNERLDIDSLKLKSGFLIKLARRYLGG